MNDFNFKVEDKCIVVDIYEDFIGEIEKIQGDYVVVIFDKEINDRQTYHKGFIKPMDYKSYPRFP